MDISVVIPAYNEEKYISKTIHSLQNCMPDEYTYEIIVVDHGSVDKTARLATSSGATVINGKEAPTIAALRNIGVEHSKGKVLFFIDADVTFTAQWSANIGKVVEGIIESPNRVCGSLPKIPNDSSLLMKYWFDPKSKYDNPKYIGSCHLLTSKKLFKAVGGFPVEMETGEDFTFCMNARQFGAQIVAFPELSVIHNGSPASLVKFAEREVWHGRGDWTNLSTLFSSKVALLTLVFLATHVVLLLCLVFNYKLSTIVPISLILIVLICLLSSTVKFSTFGPKVVLVNSFTFYIYYVSRALSLLSALTSKEYIKRERKG
ncbi:glycosyltransferase [Alkalimarinus coralli]|uniref:glycosyltransferase n=1 Tax=Alkalimarinus coralli TaxID=2935863 RepID=UPI00202B2349|nr:glycosyltransferase [Alkalimarinus coralli]